MNMYRVLTMLTMTLACFTVKAKDVHIGPVMLDSVAILNLDSFGHKAGNLEIKITNGISDLKGLTCDPNYITTTDDGIGFKNMVSVLLAARVSHSPVMLGVTDNPAYAAFPGRCSLLYAQIN